MANTELEESIAELNTIHGDSPVTMDIEHINSLFQQATQGTLDQPQTSVVPIVETINSVIARSLITMDQGKEPRINVQDMLNLQELSHRWVLTDEAKNTL